MVDDATVQDPVAPHGANPAGDTPPPRAPPRAPEPPAPWRWRRLRLRTRDEVALVAQVFEPVAPPVAAVVVAHGFCATGAHPQVIAQASALADRGYAVVTYDARGHGASGGVCTLGDDERHDVAAAVAAARDLDARVVVVGASMGAIASLRYAADDAGVNGVVAVSAPARWELPRSAVGLVNAALVRTRAGRRTLARHLRVRVAPHWHDPEPPESLVAHLGMPVAVVHGTLDRMIKPAAARLLYHAASEPRRLELVDRMGHAFHPRACAPVCASVEWALAAGTNRPQGAPTR